MLKSISTINWYKKRQEMPHIFVEMDNAMTLPSAWQWGNQNILLLFRLIRENVVNSNGILALEDSFYAVLLVSKHTKYLNIFLTYHYWEVLFRRISAVLCKDRYVQCHLHGLLLRSLFSCMPLLAFMLRSHPKPRQGYGWVPWLEVS